MLSVWPGINPQKNRQNNGLQARGSSGIRVYESPKNPHAEQSYNRSYSAKSGAFQQKGLNVCNPLQVLTINYSTSLLRMVDGTKAVAEVENGVVKVTIPKAEEEKPRKIVVKKR